MPNKNITKFTAFVIFAGSLCLVSAGCGAFSPNGAAKTSVSEDFSEPKTVGKLESPELNEASGLAASKCQPDVYWTHNDSGDDAFIFAINGKGGHLGTWKVAGATNVDWEDIEAIKDKGGKCFIYIGEIGDNDRERSEGTVYRVAEPNVSDSARNSSRKDPLETNAADALRFEYPDSRHDAETLLVHPVSGDIYVLSKRTDGPSEIYKLKPDFSAANSQVAVKLGEIAVPAVPNGLLTSGDISSDGKHVVLCDYFAGYELTLPAAAKNFDEIWQQKPARIDIGKRDTGEAIAYSIDGNTIIAISEKKNTPVIQVQRKPLK